jgi:hypothetical protein
MNFFTTEVSSKEIETKSIHSENAGAHQIAPQTHTFLTFNVYCRLLATSFVVLFHTFQRFTGLTNARQTASLGKQFPEESNFQVVNSSPTDERCSSHTTYPELFSLKKHKPQCTIVC